MDEWREAAYKFTQTSDRGSPPYFVGRDDVFKRIGGVVDDLRERYDCGPTVVLTGAQGSGKTSILAELRTWAGERGLLWVVPKPDEMTYDGVRNRVARTVLQDLPENKKQEPLKAGLNVGVANVSEETPSHIPKRITLENEGAFNDSLSHLISDKPHLHGKTVLLLVDEAQMIDVHEKTTRNLLLNLHMGEADSPLRFLPIYAGLATLPENLYDAGLSRLADNQNIELSPLQMHERKTCVIKTLGRFCKKVPISFVKWLATESDGWPQHLNS